MQCSCVAILSKHWQAQFSVTNIILMDLNLQGVRNRCRALNGDVVVVKLEPAWLW